MPDPSLPRKVAFTPCGRQEFLAEFSLSCPGHPQPLETEISESLRWISLHSLVLHCTLNKRPPPLVKTHGKRLADRQRLALWGVEGTISILIYHSAYMQLWQARLSPPYLHPWLILCLPSDILQIRSATGPWFLLSYEGFIHFCSLVHIHLCASPALWWVSKNYDFIVYQAYFGCWGES